jgi:hypothetical protein
LNLTVTILNFEDGTGLEKSLNRVDDDNADDLIISVKHKCMAGE